MSETEPETAEEKPDADKAMDQPHAGHPSDDVEPEDLAEENELEAPLPTAEPAPVADAAPPDAPQPVADAPPPVVRTPEEIAVEAARARDESEN